MNNLKKAQIVPFLIIAFVIIAAFWGFSYMARQKAAESFQPKFEKEITLASANTALKEYVTTCLDAKTYEAIDLFGVSYEDPNLPLTFETYISSTLPECINFQEFENQGFQVTAGTAIPHVKIEPTAVIVDLDYKVSLKKGDEIKALNQFNNYIKTSTATNLPLDSNGRTTQEETIRTPDADAEVNIPAGTRITNSDGNPINDVEFNMLDRNNQGMSNAPIIGTIIYDGKPDGATFDPPITIKVRYDENDVPPPLAENEPYLVLAYFDESAGFWKSIPTTVDTENNILTGTISHFTKVATGVRTVKKDDESVEEYSFTELVFVQSCGTLKTCQEMPKDNWEVSEPGLFETAFILEDSRLYDWHVRPVEVGGNTYETAGDITPNPSLITGSIPNSECGTNGKPIDYLKFDQLKDSSQVACEDYQYNPLIDNTNPTEGRISACSSVNLDELYEKCIEKVKSELGLTNEQYEDLQTNGWINDQIMDHDEQGNEIKGCRVTVTAEKDAAGGINPSNFDFHVEIAPHATYGYPSGPKGAGGWGMLKFTVAGDNGLVITDAEGNADVSVSVDCGEDTCGSCGGDEPACDGTRGIVFNPSEVEKQSMATWSTKSLWENVDGFNEITEGKIKSGENELWVYVENKENDGKFDGCAYAKVTMKIKGSGIFFNQKAANSEICKSEEGSGIKVQHRINYLCGCDGDCTDDGERDGKELSALIDLIIKKGPEVRQMDLCHPLVTSSIGFISLEGGVCNSEDLTRGKIICPKNTLLTKADQTKWGEGLAGCICGKDEYDGNKGKFCCEDGIKDGPCDEVSTIKCCKSERASRVTTGSCRDKEEPYGLSECPELYDTDRYGCCIVSSVCTDNIRSSKCIMENPEYFSDVPCNTLAACIQSQDSIGCCVTTSGQEVSCAQETQSDCISMDQKHYLYTPCNKFNICKTQMASGHIPGRPCDAGDSNKIWNHQGECVESDICGNGYLDSGEVCDTNLWDDKDPVVLEECKMDSEDPSRTEGFSCYRLCDGPISKVYYRCKECSQYSVEEKSGDMFVDQCNKFCSSEVDPLCNKHYVGDSCVEGLNCNRDCKCRPENTASILGCIDEGEEFTDTDACCSGLNKHMSGYCTKCPSNYRYMIFDGKILCYAPGCPDNPYCDQKDNRFIYECNEVTRGSVTYVEPTKRFCGCWSLLGSLLFELICENGICKKHILSCAADGLG
ncbi:MAG: hypothetical protein ABIG95_05195 [Candidatus Woesearchaeota archaeon]